jgi:hypothetical protein
MCCCKLGKGFDLEKDMPKRLAAQNEGERMLHLASHHPSKPSQPKPSQAKPSQAW